MDQGGKRQDIVLLHILRPLPLPLLLPKMQMLLQQLEKEEAQTATLISLEYPEDTQMDQELSPLTGSVGFSPALLLLLLPAHQFQATAYHSRSRLRRTLLRKVLVLHAEPP